MIDLGGARATFRIELTQAIRDLKEASRTMEVMGEKSLANKRYGKALVQVMKEQHPELAKIIGRATSYATATERINAALDKEIRKTRDLARARAALGVQTTRGGSFSGQALEAQEGPLSLAAYKKMRQDMPLVGAGAGFRALPTGKPFADMQSEAIKVSEAIKTATRVYADFSRVGEAVARTVRRITQLFSHQRQMDVSPTYRWLAREFGKIAAAGMRLIPTNRGVSGSLKLVGRSALNAVKRVMSFRGAIGNVRSSLKRFSNSIRNSSSSIDAWWKRFGQVAAGFWIAYRAINAVEMGISKMTRTFASGVQVMDDYKSGVATVAGMLSLMSEGGAGFQDRFETIKVVMRDTMREAMRLAPAFALSMDEISEGFKELAQFGVIVTKDMTRDTLTSIAMIKEIAHTVGSTSRQLRQEIQSLFNGQTRVTDQFGRFLKRVPELEKALYGIAKANTTNTEKWKMVIEKMAEFRFAITDAITTVTGQAQVLENSLKVISMLALENSNIYGSWVTWLAHFNKSLFTAEGELGDLGKTVYRAFYRVWQVIARIPLVLGDIYRIGQDIVAYVVDFYNKYRDILIPLGKVLLVSHMLRFAFKTTFGIITLIVSPITTILKSCQTLGTALFKIVGHMKKFSGLTVGVAAWAGAIAGIFLGIIPLLKGIWDFLNKMFENLMHVVVAKIADSGAIGEKVISALFGDAAADYARRNAKDLGEGIMESVLLGMKSAEDKQQEYIDLLVKGVTDITNTLVDKSSSLIDSVVDVIKRKMPSLFEAFGDINMNFGADDVLAAMQEIESYIIQDQSVLSGKDKERNASLTKWLKIIQDLNSELMGFGLDEFEKDTLEAANRFAKINIELGEAIKKYPELAKYQKIITGLSEKVLDNITTEIAARRDLAVESRKRLGIETSISKLQDSYNRYLVGTDKYYSSLITKKYKLLASEYATLELYKKQNEIDAYEQQLKKIAELNIEIRELIYNYEQLNYTISKGVTEGFKQWGREASKTGKDFINLGTTIPQEMANGFKTFFFDMMKGELKSLEDYFVAFGDAVLQVLYEIMAKMIVFNLMSGMGFNMGGGSFSGLGLGGGGGGASMVTNSAGFGVNANNFSLGTSYTPPTMNFADGGLIPEHVIGVGKSGQVYQFGEKGPETVVSNKDSFRQTAPEVEVNVINNGQQSNVTSQSSRFDGKRFIVDVVLENIANNGQIGQVLRRR
jgi:lambda family phage tail tape measure protein